MRGPYVLCYENCLVVQPMTAGGAALYTVVSCSVESARGKVDWVSPAWGGAATGAFILGAKKRSAVGASLGAVIFAVAAAAPE